MKSLLNFLPIVLCFILIAAHFSRININPLAVVSLLFPLILLWKSKLAARIIQVTLVAVGIEWIRTMIHYVNIRTDSGEDWLRLATILSTVALLNFTTILVFRSRYMLDRYNLK